MKTISQKEIEVNCHWWASHRAIRIETHLALYANPRWSSTLKTFGSFERCANVYIDESFYLLMSGAEELAKRAAEYAKIMAQEALEQSSFESRPFEFKNSLGSYRSTRYLYYADWFLTGIRSTHLLSQALKFQFESYMGKPIWYDIEDVLMDYAHSDLIQNAFEVASFIAEKKTASRSPDVKLLLSILMSEEGVKGLSEQGQRFLERRFLESLRWYHNKPRLPWWIRLNWLLLREDYYERTPSLHTDRDFLTGTQPLF